MANTGVLRVFISAATEDGNWAERVHGILERGGHRPFRQVGGTGTGGKFMQTIAEEIEGADRFVAIVSRSYCNKPHCIDELDLAKTLEVKYGGPRLVILRIEDCDLPVIVVHHDALNVFPTSSPEPSDDQILSVISEPERRPRNKDVPGGSEPEAVEEAISSFLQEHLQNLGHRLHYQPGRPPLGLYIERELWPCEGATDYLPDPPTFSKKEALTWSKVSTILTSRWPVLVAGDPGLGKTMLLVHEVIERSRTWMAADPDRRAAGQLLPAVYVLADQLAAGLEASSGKFVDALTRCVLRSGDERIPAITWWLRSRLEHGSLIIAVDALDEVRRERRVMFQEGLRLRLTNARVPVLLASRKAVLDEPPIEPCSTWILLSFDEKRCRSFIRRWFAASEQKSEPILKATATLESLADLMENPLILALACDAIRTSVSEESPAGEVPLAITNRGYLYGRIIDRLRLRWRQRVQIRDGHVDGRAENALIEAFQAFAWTLWRQDPNRALFNWGDIRGPIQECLDSGLISAGHDLVEDLRDAGLLLRETASGPSPDFTFRFLHRTLMEFLAAGHLARGIRSTAAATEVVSDLLREPDRGSLLWMVIAQSADKPLLLRAVTDWLRARPLDAPQMPPFFSSEALARMVLDCLLECPPGSASPSVREIAWSSAVRGLDALQRRRREREWFAPADPGLLGVTLLVARMHEPHLPETSQVIALLDEMRRNESRLLRGGHFPRDFAPEAQAILERGVRSDCVVIRWTSVWLAGAFHVRGRQDLSTTLLPEIVRLSETDPEPFIQGSSFRLIGLIGGNRAFEILSGGFERLDGPAAAGAALGLERLGGEEVLRLLLDRADALVDRISAGGAGRKGIAVLGALEWLVSTRNRRPCDVPGARDRLAQLFLRALRSPVDRLVTTGASALGKLHWTDSWDQLVEIAEGPDEATPAGWKGRASAVFACDQMAGHLSADLQETAAAFFRRIVKDGSQPIEVRRPAASGICRLASTGVQTPMLTRAALEGAMDSSPPVSTQCIRALLHLTGKQVEERLETMLSGADSRQKTILLANVLAVPTQLAVTTLIRILETERDPAVLTRAVNLVRKIRMDDKLEYTHRRPLDDLLTHEKASAMAWRFIEEQGAGDGDRRRLTVAALTVPCLATAFDPLAGRDVELVEKIRACARSMLQDDDPVAQGDACRVLSLVGTREDANSMRHLASQRNNDQLSKTVYWAAGQINRRTNRTAPLR